MGNLLFKVEDGKYVIFSTIVDDVTWFDMTREEVVEVLKEQAADDAGHAIERMLDATDKFGCSSRRYGGGNFTPDGAWAHMVESYNMNRAEKLTVEQFKARLQEEGEEMEPEKKVEMQVSDRGFKQGDIIQTGYGETIRAHESSAAMEAHVWVTIEGTAHVKEGVEIEEYSPAAMLGEHRIPATRIVPASLGAHLTLEQAKMLRAQLDHLINNHYHLED